MKIIKSKWVLFAIALSLIALVVVPVVAKGPTRKAGKSNIAQLYLVQKDHTDPNWPVIDDGAWGKMIYNTSGSALGFVFNGHLLEPENDYTLIYYPDPWPGLGLICLGSDTADAEGNVHIKGLVETGDLPADYDDNAPPADPNGAKIWLVLSGDVECGDEEDPSMIGWSPAAYLFEYDLIKFNADE